jgi:WD40 repeat protein
LIGNRALSASHDKTINVYDTSSGTHIHTLGGHTDNVCGLAALGDTAFSCSWDKTIRVWDLSSGSCRGVLSGHQAAVWSVLPLSDVNVLSGINLSPLISASADQTIKLWDITSGKCIKTFSGHTDVVRGLDLVPSDSGVPGDFVSCSNDGTIRIWSLETGGCVSVFSGHTSFVYSVKCLDREIVSCGEDRSIRSIPYIANSSLESKWDQYTDNIPSLHINLVS